MRLIDADAAKRFAKNCWPKTTQRLAINAILDSTPTIDAVPVVRCLECEKRDKEFVSANGTISCPYMEAFMPADGFCSYGEKKEDADNG